MISAYVKGTFKDENGRTIARVDAWLTAAEFVEIAGKSADVSFNIQDFNQPHLFDREVWKGEDTAEIAAADALSASDRALCRAWREATGYPVRCVWDYLRAAKEAYVWQGADWDEYGRHILALNHADTPETVREFVNYRRLGEQAADDYGYFGGEVDGSMYLFAS